MDKIEEMLGDEQNKLAREKPPEELENKLRSALNKSRKKKFYYRKRTSLVAAILIFVMFFSYGFDAMAYYGKKILGYDHVIEGSLKSLNELGEGQSIDKEYTFSDGSSIHIDGIFFDDNELLVLYTEKFSGKSRNPDIDPDTYLPSDGILIQLQGLLYDYNHRSSRGKFNKEFTEAKWVYQFEPPDFFEKWLSFKVYKNINGQMETGTISFTLDRDKAIKYSVKQKIDRSITIEGNEISFDTIRVSPMSTVITGKVKKHTDEFFSDNKDRSTMIRFDLIANGKKIQSEGGGISGTDFELEFDGISEADKLEIANIQIEKSRMVDRDFHVDENMKNIRIGEGKEFFLIKDLYTKDGKTYLVVERKENVNAVIGLFQTGEQLRMISKELIARETLNHQVEERWLYDSDSLPNEIMVKVLKLTKDYEGVINIPIE